MMYILCMTKQLSLTADERDFFKNVAQAAFANPFSQARVELDRKIADSDAAMPWDDLVELAISRITERLALLKASGRDDLKRYAADDRELLRTVFLFDIYHRYRRIFDGFILKQLASGDGPIPVPFARELLSPLSGDLLPDPAGFLLHRNRPDRPLVFHARPASAALEQYIHLQYQLV